MGLKNCFCGCGSTTKSIFAPGHDAKLKARLRREYGAKFDEIKASSVVNAARLLVFTNEQLVKSRERQSAHGEVYTPEFLIEKMLNLIPDAIWNDPSRTVLEPACGNGNFVVAIIERKIQRGSSLEQALSTTFGVDILEDNIKECRQRIHSMFIASTPKAIRPRLRAVVKKNVVCVDALDLDFGIFEAEQLRAPFS